MDFTLLIPFDPGRARVGDALVLKLFPGEEEPVQLVALSGPNGLHAVRDGLGNMLLVNSSCLLQSPLSWVGGRPVYPADILIHPDYGRVAVTGCRWAGVLTACSATEGGLDIDACSCRWPDGAEGGVV